MANWRTGFNVIQYRTTMAMATAFTVIRALATDFTVIKTTMVMTTVVIMTMLIAGAVIIIGTTIHISAAKHSPTIAIINGTKGVSAIEFAH